MAICAKCGRENPEGARFCNGCGADLAAEPPRVLEERKVVSVLFCDLVGFTASTETADLEDVSRELGAYHAAVRDEIERFGGTVEKFIGDAVVGVWGAPVVREDDAERTVRSALGIVDSVTVGVRVAVNTGEALVKVDAGADPGVGVVGDVVNTASRLQSIAPVGVVLVGEGTMRATSEVIEYRALEPVSLKGKSEPVAVWRAIAARTARGERRETSATPFVGRQTELELLQRVYERALAEPGLQLVTIVGEPGVGKSRLVAELAGWLDTHPPSPVVRRGRCLAYGDGIGFWPLAEVVKSELGIAETDSEDEARTKLRLGVEGMTDAPWLRTRLAPLVGLPGEAGEREEVFSAWQRFLDEIAARAPLVLVIEDIHWADSAMLAFMRHLAEWSSGVPLLLVCTTRPELLETHAGWGGDLVNATTVAVRPLNNDDTSTLAHALVKRIVDSTKAAATLAARCGGNPLYAEEYARLLNDRTASASVEAAMPDTVHALIAARIDTLPPERKALLHDAAVIGKVFWAGALAVIGDRDAADVRAHLHELARKELIRRIRISTVRGDEEFVFWHDLVHDVAYQQIPRTRRATLHRRTAAWIENASEDRVGDRAELIAYHYREAHTLTRATGDGDPEPLRRAAVRALTIAGEQAGALDRAHASDILSEGLAIADLDDAERPRLLCLLGECAKDAGELDEARSLLQEARDAAEAQADITILGETLFNLLQVEFYAGERARAVALASDAVERLEREAPSPQLARVLAVAGFQRFIDEDFAAAGPLIAEGLQIGEETHDPLAIALATNFRGLLRSQSGERGGLDDLMASLEMFVEMGSPWTILGHLHLADQTFLWDGPAAPLFDEAIRVAQRIRSSVSEIWSRAEDTWRLADLGAWDELLVAADEVLAWADLHPLVAQHRLFVAPQKARVLALRGDIPNARTAMTDMLDQARRANDPQVLGPALAAAALIEHIDHDPDAARSLLLELGPAARNCYAPTAEICRILIACGRNDVARTIVDSITSGPPRLMNAIPSVQAMLAESEGSHALAIGHYQDATTRWRAYGHALELAHALAGEARCLTALGRASEAGAPRADAASILQRLGVNGRAVPSNPSPP